ncbi:PEP-CTERM sorting domain-containing protein [Elioraea thermophila]|uniref:PEP-CTERM sorting domain-containing protein n=1 Tax=Elioraea thermophila TaxID=2185104 RepID=UPI0018E55366|nr:PEP-CTERM sorting domain-containing protein [Elioraea thermophila]
MRPNPLQDGDEGSGTTVVATQGGAGLPLTYIGSPAAPAEFNAVTRFNPALAGSWTLTISNPGSANSPQTVATPSLFRADGTLVDAIGLARNVGISGTGTTPRITFDAPEGSRVDTVGIRIWDLSLDGGRQIHAVNRLPADTRHYDIPAVLSSGLSLREGGRYAFSVDFEERRPLPEGGLGDVISRSRTFVAFTPIAASPTPPGGDPAPAVPVFLPVVEPGRVTLPDGTEVDRPIFRFDFDVTPGATFRIDPEVAVGYDYAIGAGDPRFASVSLPDIGDGLFDLYLWDETAGDWVEAIAGLAAGVVFAFPDGGVDRFRVLGIEPEAGLDPNDVTAFPTDLTFTAAGRFTGTMTPLLFDPRPARPIDPTPIDPTPIEPPVVGVPEPASLALLGLGLLGLGFARRRA